MSDFYPTGSGYGFVPFRAPTPDPPTGLTATPCDGEVHLAWTPASIATAQKIYLGTTSGSEPYSVTVAGDASTYDATQLVDGTTYYFRVTTLQGSIESDPSNEASAEPFTLLTPSVTYTPSFDAINVQIDNRQSYYVTYTAYVGTSSGNEAIWNDTTPQSDGLEINGLSESTTYYIVIRATDPCGNYEESIEGVVTTHGRAATPAISPDAGTYNNNQTCSITCSTPASSIYYTTDGSAPTPASTLYTGSFTVSATETVKAIATAPDFDTSLVASSAYTLVCATPSFDVGTGTYNNDQTLTITCATTAATIHYTTDGSTPTSGSPTYSAPLTISATETVKAIAIKGGYTNSSVQSATYTMVVSTPSISPASGTYSIGQAVTITCSTTGAAIHYTEDGSTPTDSSPTYSGPITLTSSETVKAIAIKTGYTNSGVSSQTYTVIGHLEFNSSSKGAAITLSNSDRTATKGASANNFETVFSTKVVSAVAQDLYAELSLDNISISGGTILFGVSSNHDPESAFWDVQLGTGGPNPLYVGAINQNGSFYGSGVQQADYGWGNLPAGTSFALRLTILADTSATMQVGYVSGGVTTWHAGAAWSWPNATTYSLGASLYQGAIVTIQGQTGDFAGTIPVGAIPWQQAA